MDALEQDLRDVENELDAVQVELDALLQRQEELVDRKNMLKLQLESMQQGRGSTSSAPDARVSTTCDWEGGEFPWNSEAVSTLKSTFKMDGFRPLQLSCINATLSRKDAILIMPTGGGKSLCYQLPAVMGKGVTLVISPLVSLMEDQLLAVKKVGIKSCTLNASSSREDVNRTHADMLQPNPTLKLLYVTPEKIAKSKRFMSKLEKTYENDRLTRIVIDEVHCASQWGHDFRPDYKILGILKRQFPSVPILGLTATATSKVLEDIKEMLSLKECLVFRASYNRSNLFYEVRVKSSAQKAQMDVMAALIKRKFTSESGIVYCFSRKDTEDVSSGLCERRIRAAYYHADLPLAQRSRVHMEWLNNSLQVIVATVAFGMGIDKPDVRFVIHHSISKSMENYYQESGRAGRDGKPACCILYFRAADTFRQSTMVFTEHTGLQNLYIMLRYCLNKAECRRAIIARCFGERWVESDCNGSCDICLQSTASGEVVGCSSRGSSAECSSIAVDITEHCKMLVDIIEDVKDKDKRLTALKVMELWQQRLKKEKTSSPLGLEDKECIFLHALVEGVLKEDFHFTPYSTISYIGLGRKAQGVKRNIVKVHMKKMAPAGRGVAGSTKAVELQKSPSTQQHPTASNTISRGSIRMGAAIIKSNAIEPPKSATGARKGGDDPKGASNTKQDLSHSESSAAGVSAVKRHLPSMLLPSSETSSAAGSGSGIGILPRKRLKLSRSNASQDGDARKDRTQIVID